MVKSPRLLIAEECVLVEVPCFLAGSSSEPGNGKEFEVILLGQSLVSAARAVAFVSKLSPLAKVFTPGSKLGLVSGYRMGRGKPEVKVSSVASVSGAFVWGIRRVRKTDSFPKIVVASALGSAGSRPPQNVLPLAKGASRPVARKRRSKVASTGSFLPEDLVAFGPGLCMGGVDDNWHVDGVVGRRLECILVSRFHGFKVSRFQSFNFPGFNMPGRKVRVSGMCRIRCRSSGSILHRRLELLANSVASRLYPPCVYPWSGNGLNCAAGSLHDRLGIGT